MKLQRFFILASCATLMSACSPPKFGAPTNPAYPNAAACAGNHYLERYNCSIEQMTAAARSGDADAQYGLGYMYYYGIGTMRDETTARSWIKQAAAQGQPLAIKAYQMMTGQVISGPHQRGMHSLPRANTTGTAPRPRKSLRQAPEDVTELNNQKVNRPVQEQLPAYRKDKKKEVKKENSMKKPDGDVNAVSTKAVVPANDSSTPAPSSQNAPQNNSPAKNPNASASNNQYAPHTNSAVKNPIASALNNQNAPNASAANNQTSPQNNSTVKNPNTSASNNQAAPQNNSVAKNPSNSASNNQNIPAKPVQKAEAMGQASIPEKMSSAERWMMQHPGKHYSLQIMGSHDLKAIQNFIAQNHLEGKARYYSAELQGQKWYMLVYGDFNSARQAFKASKKLPQDLRSHHPWIKSYAEIQKEISAREIIS